MDKKLSYLEYDPIKPFIYPEARVLILGSFPARKARETGFYYAHPSNQFWKVIAKVLKADYPDSIDQRKALLKKNKIALWNVCKACSIRGSKDSSIKNVIPNDLATELKNTKIKQIFTSGKTAQNLYKKYCYKDVGIEDIYLPSTSAANRPNYSFDQLVDYYSQVLKFI